MCCAVRTRYKAVSQVLAKLFINFHMLSAITQCSLISTVTYALLWKLDAQKGVWCYCHETMEMVPCRWTGCVYGNAAVRCLVTSPPPLPLWWSLTSPPPLPLWWNLTSPPPPPLWWSRCFCVSKRWQPTQLICVFLMKRGFLEVSRMVVSFCLGFVLPCR